MGRGWAYTGALLGGAVSIAANIAHSYVPPVGALAGWVPERGAVGSAVFWPVALLVAVEIFARTGWPTGKRWVVARFLGLLPVAIVAAVVSYRHMSGLLAFYAEDPLTATIGPLAVDGLMVMATSALIGTSRRRAGEVVSDDTETEAPEVDPLTMAKAAQAALAAALELPSELSESGRSAGGTDVPAGAPRRRRGGRKLPPSSAPAVAKFVARNPDATPTEVAVKVGISESTARRHLAAIVPPTTSTPEVINTPTGVEINNHVPVLTGASKGAPS
jgi:hypothetical protein